MRKLSKAEREKLDELHYWQMRVRQDIASLKRTVEKCKKVAAKLRALQNQKGDK